MANIIPSPTSDLEGGLGEWAAWFGCTVAHSTTQVADGTGSMEVTATSSDVGFQTNNWPGFAVSNVVGVEHELSAKCYKPSGTALTVSFDFHWRDDGGTNLLTTTVDVPADSSGWQEASLLSTPPSGTTRLYIQTTWNGASGDVVYVDTVSADNAPSSGSASATLDTTLPGLSSGLTAEAVNAVALAASLPGLTADLTSGAVASAEFAVTLPGLTAGLTATLDAPQLSAALGATLPGFATATLAAEVVASATLAATLPGLGPSIAPRDVTILKVGTPTSKWKASTPTSAWAATAPKAKWQASTPTKRWTATAPTRTDPS